VRINRRTSGEVTLGEENRVIVLAED